MKRLFVTLLVLVLLVLPILTFSQDVIYIRTTSVRVSVDHNGLDGNGQPMTRSHIEWRLIREDGQIFDYVSPWAVPTTTVTIQRPRSGTYEVRARVCGTTVGGQFMCSEYSSSLDASKAVLTADSKSIPPVPPEMAGKSGTWKVRFKPSAPLGPIIIQ